MSNKRGIGQEIDWILGVGLFILSVAFVMVIFKPGIKPLYDSQTLLDIVQDGLLNDTTWEITTVPVFVYPANETAAGSLPRDAVVNLSNEQINLSSGDTSPFNSLENLIEGFDNKLNIEFYYIRRTNVDIPPSGFDIELNEENPDVACEEGADGEDICEGAYEESDVDRGIGRERINEARGLYHHEDFEREDQMIYNLTSNKLIVPVKLEAGSGGEPSKTKYLITVSDRPINFFLEDLGPETTLNACARQGEGDAVSLDCPVIYELGLTEKVMGLDMVSFITLNETTGIGCSTGYECVKEKWKFPLSKEFRIKVESLPISEGGGPLVPFNYTFPPSNITIPSNINVFVRQFNSFILTDDGTRIPITVRITIW